MISHPKTKDMWYDKLRNSSKNDSLLENLNLAVDEYSEEECLAMRKYSKSNPMFSISVEACDRKNSVICRLDPQMINSLAESPKFPCLQPNRMDRRKRSFSNGEDQRGGKREGL